MMPAGPAGRIISAHLRLLEVVAFDEGRIMTLTWVFVQGQHRIEVRRMIDPRSAQLEVTDGERDARTFTFQSHAALVAFQAGFEHALSRAGWTLKEFQPERRAGIDRRAISRHADRRGSLALVWSR